MTMTQEASIQIKGLSHTYERWSHRVRALQNVSLTIRRGQWVTLVGPNGSGKSTLLRLLAGQLILQKGHIRIAGLDVHNASRRELAHHLFLVHQDPTAGTAPTLTVAEHVMLADGAAGRHRQSVRRCRDLLASVRLDVPLHQPVASLSGGQRQLLVLLMAMLRPAQVVLLDEPLAALDPDRARLCDHALKQLGQAGKTMVLVTHDIDYALSRGDRTITLVEGNVVGDETSVGRTRERVAAAWGWSNLPGGAASGYEGEARMKTVESFEKFSTKFVDAVVSSYEGASSRVLRDAVRAWGTEEADPRLCLFLFLDHVKLLVQAPLHFTVTLVEQDANKIVSQFSSLSPQDRAFWGRPPLSQEKRDQGKLIAEKKIDEDTIVVILCDTPCRQEILTDTLREILDKGIEELMKVAGTHLQSALRGLVDQKLGYSDPETTRRAPVVEATTLGGPVEFHSNPVGSHPGFLWHVRSVFSGSPRTPRGVPQMDPVVCRASASIY